VSGEAGLKMPRFDLSISDSARQGRVQGGQMSKFFSAAAAIALAASCTMASAATVDPVTITFDGTVAPGIKTYAEGDFTFTGLKKNDLSKQEKLNFSNDTHCLEGRCLFLNPGDVVVMQLDGVATFSLLSLVFNFQGNPSDSAFSVVAAGASGPTSVTVNESTFVQQDFWTYSFGVAFQNVTSVTFYGLNNGNTRIDNLLALLDDGDFNTPEVPLPATGLLLAGALGAAAGLRRRRNG